MDSDLDKPYYTMVYLGCWKCGERTTKDLTMQRCSSCKRVCYCSRECQQHDWREHKSFCKALVGIENPPNPLLQYHDEPYNHFNTEIEKVNYNAKANGSAKTIWLNMKAGRGLSPSEQALVNFEPRCLACARTAMDIRVDQAISLIAQPTRTMRPCKDCGYSFYCSDEHYQSAHHMHSAIPYEDGHDGLSQCEMNQEIKLNDNYAFFLSKNMPSAKYFVRTGPVKSVWESLENQTWHSEYTSWFSNHSESPEKAKATVLRRHSDILTLSMTVLFALEKLNPGDDAWTRKEALAIHFIGADLQEMRRELALEEHFHRLPGLKEIKFLLCGPAFRHAGGGLSKTREMAILSCPSCAAHGNKIIETYYADTYHAFVKQQGAGYTPPDLAVAFNSDCGVGLETKDPAYRILDMSAGSSSSWRETETLLIEKKIPTLFTANNPEDAINDEQQLIKAGAKFMPSLGRQQNPWGSMLSRPRPNMVSGFESYNRWIVGGFR